MTRESHRTLGIDTPRKKQKTCSAPTPQSASEPVRALIFISVLLYRLLIQVRSMRMFIMAPSQPLRKGSRLHDHQTDPLPCYFQIYPILTRRLRTCSKWSIPSGQSIPSFRVIFHLQSDSNYWTHQGGLREVISVLPSKDQADM